ncbi:MAG TPA: restriction endonuclease, partial [Chloroflexia bacterium]|nr:restriction endonuclease [Chloroflexia bacterium]
MPYDLKWDALSPSDFEEFVFWLVTALGYDDPKRVSGTGDEGEDIVAFLRPLPNIGVSGRKWVFQCKHTNRVTKADIEGELANFIAGGIDTWVLVTTAQPSTQMRRWFERLRSSMRYPFHIEAWWGEDVERITRATDEPLLKVLPLRLSA